MDCLAQVSCADLSAWFLLLGVDTDYDHISLFVTRPKSGRKEKESKRHRRKIVYLNYEEHTFNALSLQ
jgi:hypothetical protein